MIPALGLHAVVDVEDDVHASFAVGRGRRSMDAARTDGAKVKPAVREGAEAMIHFVVIAEQILRPALVAAEQQDVLVANRPEVRARAILARYGENIALDEGAAVYPTREILGKKEMLYHPAVVHERPVPVGAG